MRSMHRRVELGYELISSSRTEEMPKYVGNLNNILRVQLLAY
jgi:hypothetical protein